MNERERERESRLPTPDDDGECCRVRERRDGSHRIECPREPKDERCKRNVDQKK